MIIIKIFISLFFYLSFNVLLYSQNDSANSSISYNKDTVYLSIDSSLEKLTNQRANTNWFELSVPILVAIIGGLIAIYQVRINIIKSARINWIENLRHNISHFISSTENVRHNLDLMRGDIDSGIDPNKAFANHSKELIVAFNESIMYVTKVRLYLNLREDLHKELNEKIGDFIEASSNSFDKRNRNEVKENILTITNEIIILSQKILKKEWDRVSKTWFKRVYQKYRETA